MGVQINTEINDIVREMKQRYGRDISMYDEGFLSKSIERRWRVNGVEEVADYLICLKENPVEAGDFYDSLNINYSQFFRNSLSFAVLEQVILPQLMNRKADGGEIRVWSAGCAAGQEAYSMGMLLSDFMAVGERSIRFRIFATDISQTVLAMAKDGIYPEDAVQNLKVKHLHHYFEKTGKTYTIVPQLKKTINFSTYDLLDQSSANPPESIYGDFDIIFCSNLLFYYKPEVRRRILEKIKKSLSANGYFVTDDAEAAFIRTDERLKMVSPCSAIFQVHHG